MNPEAATKYGVKAYDAADYLNTPEDCAAYLEACMADAPDDYGFLLEAVGDVVKAQRKMSAAANQAGVSREALYKGLAMDGNPSLITFAKVLKSVGIEFTFRPAANKQEKLASA